MANIDSELLEKWVVSHLGSFEMIESAITLAIKVRYLKGCLVTEGKFHVSIGHSTVIATATFWGAKGLKSTLSTSSFGGSAETVGLSQVKFDFD